MKTGDFLKTLADKIGKTDDTTLNDFISTGNHIDMPDELCNAIVSNLMSLEGAKNNTTVKKHFTTTALNSVDSEVLSVVKELGLDVTAFEQEKNTFERMRMLKTSFKELLDKKPDTSGELETKNKELQQKYVDAQKQIADIQELSKQEKAAIQAAADEMVLGQIRQTSFKGLKWAREDQPEDVQIEFAKMVMAKSLAAVKAKEVNRDGKIELVNADDPTLKYYENGKEVDYESFKSKVLADNALLAVTNNNPANIQPHGSSFIPASINPADVRFKSEINKALAGLGK